jgi:hypothetical protein
LEGPVHRTLAVGDAVLVDHMQLDELVQLLVVRKVRIVVGVELGIGRRERRRSRGLGRRNRRMRCRFGWVLGMWLRGRLKLQVLGDRRRCFEGDGRFVGVRGVVVREVVESWFGVEPV